MKKMFQSFMMIIMWCIIREFLKYQTCLEYLNCLYSLEYLECVWFLGFLELMVRMVLLVELELLVEVVF